MALFAVQERVGDAPISLVRAVEPLCMKEFSRIHLAPATWIPIYAAYDANLGGAEIVRAASHLARIFSPPPMHSPVAPSHTASAMNALHYGSRSLS